MSDKIQRTDNQQIIFKIPGAFGERVKAVDVEGNRLPAIEQFSWHWTNFISLPSRPSGIWVDLGIWTGTTTIVCHLMTGLFLLSLQPIVLITVGGVLWLPLILYLAYVFKFADRGVQGILWIRIFYILLGIGLAMGVMVLG